MTTIFMRGKKSKILKLQLWDFVEKCKKWFACSRKRITIGKDLGIKKERRS